MADRPINGAPNAPFPLPLNTYIAFDVVDPSSPTGYKFSKGTVSDFLNQIGVVDYEIRDNLNGTYSLVNAVNPAITYGNIIMLPTLTNLGGGIYEYNRFDGNPIQFTTGGGGGGTTLFYSVTKAQLDTHIANSTLVEGATYWINDRGDVGLFFKAVSTNWLDFENGYRIMRVPFTYQAQPVNSNTIHGIWHLGLTVLVGDYAIWGGKVWQNTTGNVGSSVDAFTLGGTDWVLVPKTNNDVYIYFGLGCNYDYLNDWIAFCWDKKGNKFGLDFYNRGGYADSPTNYCDWNVDNIVGNTSAYICNNHNMPTIVGNNMGIFYIANNAAVMSISYNNLTSGHISSNSSTSIVGNSGSGSINDNSNSGPISNNQLLGDISFNSNGGGITNNRVIGTISLNSNSMGIDENSCNGSIIDNSNNGNISKNSNLGSISNNENSGQIFANCNNGYIGYNQSNVTDIIGNSNSGDIEGNNNQGTIKNNANAGTIISNENNGNIERNINNGVIEANANSGHISANRNNGYILDASSFVLAIENNNNNGVIDGSSLSGNISDPIVDKL